MERTHEEYRGDLERDIAEDMLLEEGAPCQKRCWDNGASSLELEGREAKQLGSLSREGGIDKVIGKKTQALSLWRQLLSGVKERYPFSEDDVCWPGKWTTIERGIQYLRELAMQQMIYYNLNNAQLPTSTNLPRQALCTYNGGSNHRMAGNVFRATTWSTMLGLEKQVLWRHGTPDRIESDNGTHFRNNLTDTWAKEHGIEWVYHIPYHAPASGKIE
ncbi:hypothetical protein GRJ2_000489700 [Grus japonensis]|uniref:Integrase catalytic domain-containing protein n=1 Tax=Grus japonensis TaxID=30415 RepID=A0ABC9W3Q9_GRUJA